MVWIKKLLFGEGKDQRVIKVEVSSAMISGKSTGCRFAEVAAQRSSNYLPGVSEKYTSSFRCYDSPVSLSYAPFTPSLQDIARLSSMVSTF